MDHIEQKLDRIDERLERIDGKLDVHLERLTKTERDVHWLSGHLKIATGFVLAIATGFITYLLTN